MSLITRLLGFKERRNLSSQSFGDAIPLWNQSIGAQGEVYGIPAAKCAVQTIAELFAGIPVEIIEETKSGTHNVVRHHNLSHRLNWFANDELNAYDWKIASVSHYLLWGNTYDEIVTTRGGDFHSFNLMLPQYTSVLRGDDRSLIYRTTLYPDMRTETLDAAEVLHVKNLTNEGLVGIPAITASRMAFELANQQESYALHWYRNNSKPGGFYKFPNNLSDQAKNNIILSHKKEFAGASNANKVGILDNGGSFELTTIPSADGQFLESRTFQLSEIARIFNISPALLHGDSVAYNANLETINTHLVTKTLLPIIRRWEAELKRKCLRNEPNLHVHFNCKSLMRGDITTQDTHYNSGLQNGTYCINEVRAERGQPPIGPEGDVYRVQLNLGAGDNGKGEPSNPDPDEAKKEDTKTKKEDNTKEGDE